MTEVREALAQYEAGALTYTEFMVQLNGKMTLKEIVTYRNSIIAAAQPQPPPRPRGWAIMRAVQVILWFFSAGLLIARVGLATSIQDLKVLHLVAIAVMAISWGWLPSIKDK